jgi:heat shock protein HslJ
VEGLATYHLQNHVNEIERWWSSFSKEDLKSFPLMMQTKFQEAGKWVFGSSGINRPCFGATLVQQRITIFGSFFQGIDGICASF